MSLLSSVNYTYGNENSNSRRVDFFMHTNGEIEAKVYNIANKFLCSVSEDSITVDCDSTSFKTRAILQARMGYPTPLVGKRGAKDLTKDEKEKIFRAIGQPYKLDIENVPGALHEEVSSIEVFNPT